MEQGPYLPEAVAIMAPRWRASSYSRGDTKHTHAISSSPWIRGECIGIIDSSRLSTNTDGDWVFASLSPSPAS